jgi:dynactin complex subunit
MNWSPNGHNGSVDGKSYFVCSDGNGIFVTVTSIIGCEKGRQETVILN